MHREYVYHSFFLKGIDVYFCSVLVTFNPENDDAMNEILNLLGGSDVNRDPSDDEC